MLAGDGGMEKQTGCCEEGAVKDLIGRFNRTPASQEHDISKRHTQSHHRENRHLTITC